jgi:hypothetical protein
MSKTSLLYTFNHINQGKKKNYKDVFCFGEPFDLTRNIVSFQSDMIKLLEDPCGFVLNIGLRLSIHECFNVKWDKDYTRQGFILLDEEENLRIGLSMLCTHTLFSLKSSRYLVAMVPTFSCRLKEGEPEFEISQECQHEGFKGFNLFIEEPDVDSGSEYIFEEIDLVPIYQFNGRLVFVEYDAYFSMFGVVPVSIKACHVRPKSYAMIVFQRMLILHGFIANIFVQFPKLAFSSPEVEKTLLIFNPVSPTDDGRMVRDKFGVLTLPEADSLAFWDEIVCRPENQLL